MQKKMVAAIAALALGVGGTSLASSQFASTFQATYSSQIPGSPSGLDALATWSDPGEPGGKPKELQKINLLFNPGTKFNTAALPACRTSDERVQILAVRACPRATKLGEVHTQGVYAGGTPFKTLATLFNARRQIIVVVVIDDGSGRLLTNFRDDVRGSAIAINLKIPHGISLITFQAHVPPHSLKRGKKRRTYFRTPTSCPPSRVWTTTVTFSYRDGSTDQHTATSPCRPY